MTRLLVLGLTLLAIPSVTRAGQFNKVLSVGDPAPAWENLEGTDGQKHSLQDFKDHDVVVVVFTCNSCPVAEGYEDRILAFAQKHAGKGSKVGLVAINVNTVPADRLPKMKERADQKKFPFPYLYDPSQKIAKAYGAMYTPEFFVIGRDRKIAYMGAMDDKSPPADAKTSFLELAVDAALHGQRATVTETLGRGCRIRWNRSSDEE
ncbi:MAG: thioredoxin family protein [Bacteroidales bacterium]|nr:thioredoxin family protein [Bacteroidales bacterium]